MGHASPRALHSGSQSNSKVQQQAAAPVVHVAALVLQNRCAQLQGYQGIRTAASGQLSHKLGTAVCMVVGSRDGQDTCTGKQAPGCLTSYQRQPTSCRHWHAACSQLCQRNSANRTRSQAGREGMGSGRETPLASPPPPLPLLALPALARPAPLLLPSELPPSDARAAAACCLARADPEGAGVAGPFLGAGEGAGC